MYAQNHIARSRYLTHALFFLLLCLICANSLAQQPSNEVWRHTRQEWTLDLPSSGPVRVENPWGDIRIRTHGKDEVYVLANIQNHQDDPRAMSLVIDNESKDKLGVKAHFSDEYNGTPVPDWQPRRIDLTLFLPAAQMLELQTEKGLIEVRGMAAPLSARSLTGEIRLRVKNAVEVFSENGRVEIFFVSTGWTQDAKIETRTSPVEVNFPKGARAQLAITTNGQITTDFSIDIERDENELLKTARAKIGKKKGKKLEIKSDRGAVILLSSTIPDESQ